MITAVVAHRRQRLATSVRGAAAVRRRFAGVGRECRAAITITVATREGEKELNRINVIRYGGTYIPKAI